MTKGLDGSVDLKRVRLIVVIGHAGGGRLRAGDRALVISIGSGRPIMIAVAIILTHVECLENCLMNGLGQRLGIG